MNVMADRDHRRPAFSRLALLLLPMSWGLGCAWVRGPSGPGMDPDTFPASVESESLRVELASDTTMVEPEAQEPKKPVVRRENTPSPPSTQPPPETVEPPRVDVSVKMSEEEREQLEREAHGRIIETNKILGSLDSSAFSQAKLDALLTIKGLIKSASDALEQGDVQAADSLARKALLLATDLAPK